MDLDLLAFLVATTGTLATIALLWLAAKGLGLQS
jgi:hypothetical protein